MNPPPTQERMYAKSSPSGLGQDAIRKGEVPREIDRLECALTELENRFGFLVQTLSNVLSPPDPDKQPTPTPQERICPVADAIRVQRNRIEELIARTVCLTEKIEI